MTLPATLAWQVMPQLLSSSRSSSRFPSYNNRVMVNDMLRLGIGFAIGWFAYEALQKEGVKDVPSLVKVCINKFGNEASKDKEEYKKECIQCEKKTNISD